MQPGVADARPPAPAQDWRWSDRLRRWVEPGASLLTGCQPPKEHQWKRDDPRTIAQATIAGNVSGRAKQLIAQDDRILEKIAKRWLRNCEKGDNRALAMLLDRVDGPVEQAIRATIESRYVIEERGVPYVDIGPGSAHNALSCDTQALATPRLSALASDNIHSVALGDGEVRSVKSEAGGADPDGGIPTAPQRGPTPLPAPVPSE